MARRVAIACGVAVGIICVVLSPFIIGVVSWSSRINWSRASNIGQSYGFISAILSALALGAVAWSIRQQAAQTRYQRLETRRATHMALWGMAFKDPYLLACYPNTEDTVGANKRYYYLNLHYWWWNYNFEIGLMDEIALAHEAYWLFQGEAGREYYNRALQYRAAVKTSDRNARFFRIIDDAYNRAVEAGPAVPFTVEPTIRDEVILRSQRSQRKYLLGAVALAASVGWLVRASRRR